LDAIEIAESNHLPAEEMDALSRLPRPQRDGELYSATLAAGFEAFPERLENYRLWQEAERGEVIGHLPVELDIENVSRCNYRCAMCQVSEWPKMQRAGDMSLDDFRKLIDEQYGLIDIKLQGMGEPLLAGDTYFEMINYARARHIWVRSTNNGSLLHLKDNYKKLIDSDICEAQISIDGVREATYENIRVGGKFARVSKNVEMLNRYAESVGQMRTRMWAVVQKENFSEIEAFPKYAADHGFKRLTLSLNLTDWGQKYWTEKNDRIDAHADFDAELGERIIEDGRKRDLEVTFWAVDDRYDTSSTESLCSWPFGRLYVSSDMRAVPCCVIANPEVYDLGDARELTEVWHGEAMREFRKAHLEGRIPDACQPCYKENGKTCGG
jgi:pyrroloquinoline quinone biosynthesis protein E